MRSVPLEVELSWPTPNYIDPPTRAHGILIAACICVSIISLITFARLYARIFVTRYFGPDDWMIIPTFITGIGYCATAFEGINNGWYKHVWDVRIPVLIDARKLVVATSLLGLLNVAFTKLSVLLLYIRIFPPSKTRIASYTLIALTAGWAITMSITNFLLCIPLHAYWDITYSGHQICLEEIQYFVSFSSIDLALDIAIYVLPIPKLAKLKMPLRQKIALVGIFGTGLLAVAAAALRLPALVRASSSYDLTWELYDAALWTMIEACVGIFCASAPALKPLLQQIAPSMLGTLVTSTGQKYGTNGSSNQGSKFSNLGSDCSGRRGSDLNVLDMTSSKQSKSSRAATVEMDDLEGNGSVHNFQDAQGRQFWKGHLEPLCESEEDLVHKKSKGNMTPPASAYNAI